MSHSDRNPPKPRLPRDNKYPPLWWLPPLATPPPPPPPPPPPTAAILRSQNHDGKSLLVTGMTVMGSMLSSVLLLCIFFAIVRFYFNKRINDSRRRSLPIFSGTRDDFWLDEDQIIPNFDNPIWYINTVGLQQSVIDSITVFKYKKDEVLIEGTECSVCLNEFQEDESLRLLPNCSHGFHIPCIDTWLRSHQNCPMCRVPVVCDTMVVQSSEENDETRVENNVGEGRTSEEIEEENSSENSRKNLDQSDLNVLSDFDGIQATRRSVSLDLDIELEQLKCSKGKIYGKRSSTGSSSIGSKLMKSSSIGRSLSKGPVLMKRSFSSGGIFLLSKRSKSRSSILPL